MLLAFRGHFSKTISGNGLTVQLPEVEIQAESKKNLTRMNDGVTWWYRKLQALLSHGDTDLMAIHGPIAPEKCRNQLKTPYILGENEVDCNEAQ